MIVKKICILLTACITISCTSQPRYHAQGHALKTEITNVGQQPAKNSVENTFPLSYSKFVNKLDGSKFADVYGSKMHYLEIGASSNDTYLFVHGTPVNAYVWRKVIDHLSIQNKHIILVDLIGYGQSSRPDIKYDFTDYAVYLERFIQQLDLKNVHFVAHDIGGQASFAYAAMHEQNVASIAAFETLFTPFTSFDEFDFKTKLLFTMMRQETLGNLLAVNLNLMIPNLLSLGVQYSLSKEDKDVFLYFASDKQSRKTVLNVPRSTPVEGKPERQYEFVQGYKEFLSNSDIPKLILIAEPGVVPDIQADTASKFRNSTVVTIKDAGHFLQEDKPKMLADALEKFWSEI